MIVHLVDGTYELFRHYYGAPPSRAPDGREVGATRGLLRTLLSLLRQSDASHVACAYDTTIESFRNDLFDGYKTGDGIDPDLFAQFPLAEQATRAMGVVTWSMIEFEADDALAAGAELYGKDPTVEQIQICSPDKDLAQCVTGRRIVMNDRRRRIILDEEGVKAKFGVAPASIPDWLALVGDNADGLPGVPRWGAKSAAVVLSHYQHVENIPDDADDWQVKVRGAAALATNLREARDDAMLYRKLALLRRDVPLKESLEELRWQGVSRPELEALCADLGFEDFLDEDFGP